MTTDETTVRYDGAWPDRATLARLLRESGEAVWEVRFRVGDGVASNQITPRQAAVECYMGAVIRLTERNRREHD